MYKLHFEHYSLTISVLVKQFRKQVNYVDTKKADFSICFIKVCTCLTAVFILQWCSNNRELSTGIMQVSKLKGLPIIDYNGFCFHHIKGNPHVKYGWNINHNVPNTSTEDCTCTSWIRISHHNLLDAFSCFNILRMGCVFFHICVLDNYHDSSSLMVFLLISVFHHRQYC